MSKIMRIAHPAFVLTASIFAVAATSPAFAQQAAEPAPSAAQELPAVEVVAKKKAATPAKKKQATKQAQAKKAAPVQAAAPSPEPAPGSSGAAETATSPVQEYVAKNSATGTKTDTPLRETPQSISVIGKEQIRDQGAQSLQESVRYTAGVAADTYGPDSRSDNIRIRGLDAPVYLDGMRYNYGYYVNTIPYEPYSLERIDVLRGPASVLYGQSSTGGVLNLVSKMPQAERRNEITAEYGSFDFKQIKGDFTGPLTADGKWLYRLVALGRDADTQVDFVENDRIMIAPAITFRPNSNTDFTLLGKYQKDESGSTQQFMPHVGTRFASPQGFIPVNRFVGEPDNDRYDTESAYISLLANHKFSDALSIHQGIRYTETDNSYKSFYPAPIPAGSPLFPNAPFLDPSQRTMARVKFQDETQTNIFTSDTNLVAKFDTGPVQHKVLGGFDYSRYSEGGRSGSALNLTPFDLYDPVYGQTPFFVDLSSLTPINDLTLSADNDISQEQIGLYVQEQARLGRWVFIAGLRQDWVTNESKPPFGAGPPDQKDEALTKRFGLMYDLFPGFTPYVSYSESFNPAPGTRVVSGDFAKPVEGEQVETGFKYEPAGRNFSIASAIFDIKEKNRVVTGFDIAQPNAADQIGEARIRGFEFEARGEVTDNIKIIASYTYLDTESVQGSLAATGKRLESVPDHLATFWGIYTFNSGFFRGLSLGGGVRYIGQSWDGFDVVDTPAVTLFDAMLAYDTPDWRWSLNASNLEDERYLTTCLGRGDCFVGQSRTITTGLTYKF